MRPPAVPPSLYKYHKILARAPELLWIGDAQHILLVGILLQCITARGMRREQFCRPRVELNLLGDADVNLGEVITVEVRLQNLAVNIYALLFQLALGAKHIPCRMQLLVLRIYGLCLLLALGSEVVDIGVEIGYLLVEIHDVDVFGIELGPELLQLLVFLLHLLCQVVYCALQLVALDSSLTQLALQLGNELPVLLHCRLYELQILAYSLLAIAALTLLGQAESVFGLIDFAEPLLYLVHS